MAAKNNDLAEDVAGGLQRGLDMEWKSKARYTILVTDA